MQIRELLEVNTVRKLGGLILLGSTLLLVLTGCPAQDDPQQADAGKAASAVSQAEPSATRTPDHVIAAEGEVSLPSLQAQLDEKRATSGAPEEMKAASQRLNRSLAEQELLAGAVGFGMQAPDFTLEALKGNPVNLAETYAAGPVVLFFFRGGW